MRGRLEPARRAIGRERAGPSVVAEHVLVTTDGSEAANRAVPVALAAIRACGSARVTLLRVLAPKSDVSPVHALEWALARAQVEADLRELAARFEPFHDRVDPVVVEGRAAEQILRFIETDEVDLVVLSSHGSDDARTWSMGSVARKIVASSRSSVLLAPAHSEQQTIERVLVPLDCSARAECVLPLLDRLAEAHDPEFSLVHVVPRPEIPHRLPAGMRDAELVDEITLRNRQRGEAYLQSVRSRLQSRGVNAKAVLLSDTSPARAIERHASESGADMVLLSAHGSGSDEGEAYGSVVRRLLDSLLASLWIVQDLPMAGPKRGEQNAGARPDRS